MTTSNGTSNISSSGDSSGNSTGNSSGGSSSMSGSGSGGQTALPNMSIWDLWTNFFDDGKPPVYQQLLALRNVWVNAKTYKPAMNKAERIACTKMLLFDAADRHNASALQHLPVGGIPFDNSDKKVSHEAAKGYRPWTAAPLVMQMALEVEHDVLFNNMNVKINHITGTILKDRSGKVTIHGDDSCWPIVVVVFGATCCLTVDTMASDDRKDKDKKVLVKSGSLVCVSAAVTFHAPTVAVATGGSSVVLVMRYVGELWTRSQLETLSKKAEYKKYKQAKAQYAKLLRNGSLEEGGDEEEAVCGNVNVQGVDGGDDGDVNVQGVDGGDDDAADDDDDMGGVAKKRKVKL